MEPAWPADAELAPWLDQARGRALAGGEALPPGIVPFVHRRPHPTRSEISDPLELLNIRIGIFSLRAQSQFRIVVPSVNSEPRAVALAVGIISDNRHNEPQPIRHVITSRKARWCVMGSGRRVLPMQIAADTSHRDHLVRDRLAIAARLLSAADDSDVPTLQRASLAVQNILEAVYASGGVDLAVIAPDAADPTASLLRNAAAQVAEATDGKILPERIYFLLGAASGLLTIRNDPFLADRIDYAGMLQSELAAIYHSEAITARGFPMLRAARVNMAVAEPRDPDEPLQ